jgi:cytochrome c-type biogenesis protein CcmH
MSVRACVAAMLLSMAACLPAQAVRAAQPAASAPSSQDAPMPPPEQAEALLQSDRFRHLASELRCLVCQNQTLADSSAELAVDLRNEVLRQMAAGRDDAQIKERLVARYGEFVLYRPAFSARNAALWAGPAVLMAIGFVAIWRMSRRPAATAAPAAAGDDAALRRVERLLADEPPGGPSPRG